MNAGAFQRVVRMLAWPLAAFYGLLWAGGVASYVIFGGPPAGTSWTAPAFLATAAVLAWMVSPRVERPVLLAVAAIGFAVEWVGVVVGMPFGSYHYTDALAPRIAGVPLVMGAAWLVLFAYARQMARSPWIAAAWMTAIDLVIDPLAANALGFWTWDNPGPYYGIPWSNFAGWFGVSLALFAIVRRPAAPLPSIQWLGLSIVAFFTVVAFGTGLPGAGAVGAGLISLHWARCRAASGRSDGNTAAVPPAPPFR